jgi:peptidoglycan/xylan/chitin deacetylase (PgdA/CDA1 family)
MINSLSDWNYQAQTTWDMEKQVGDDGSTVVVGYNSLPGTNSADRLILNLHGVGTMPAWVGPAEGYYWCDEGRFKSLLDDVRTVSQRVLIELTFDDGNISDAAIALAALVDRGLTASFFVCAGRIGQPGYLDSAAMNSMVSAGMVIGSHGWGHVDWRRVNDRTLDIEIDDARKKIADVVGYEIDKVSIPFGSYDRRVLRRLRRSRRIRTIYTSDNGRAPLSGWILPRVPYDGSWNRNTLFHLADPPALTYRIDRLMRRFIKRWR